MKPSEIVQRISEICVDTFYHSDITDLEQAKVIMQMKVCDLLLDNNLTIVQDQDLIIFKSKLDYLETEFNLHKVHE